MAHSGAAIARDFFRPQGMSDSLQAMYRCVCVSVCVRWEGRMLVHGCGAVHLDMAHSGAAIAWDFLP